MSLQMLLTGMTLFLVSILFFQQVDGGVHRHVRVAVIK